MLNPFPQLLFLQFYAPALLRLAVALVMFYLVYYHFVHKHEIARTRFPVIGAGMWVVWVSVVVELAVALSLFFGYGTQWAAIVLALIGLKYFVWAGKYPAYFRLSRSAAFLLLVIGVSLLFTGAGAFAMDVPL